MRLRLSLMSKRNAFEALAAGPAKAARSLSWQTVTRKDGVYLLRDDPDSQAQEKVAAFDMDGTLVNHRGSFAADASDWQVWNERVVPVMRRLHGAGYRLVVFSNQGGIKGALEGKRAAITKGYFDAFIATLGVPLIAFAAPQNDAYKKGKPGLWNAFVQRHQDGVEPALESCFFVGDAAGRPGDHSDTDKVFAKAVGMQFYTPEEAFGAERPPWEPFAVGGGGAGGEGAGAAAAQPDVVDLT